MARISAWLALLFLLFAFTTKLECAIASSVLDTDNIPVQNGGDYYILPIFEGEGGGLTLASIGVRHPPAVVQHPSENFLGLPVTISDGTMIIQTDGNLTIKFTQILDSSTWMIVMDDSANVWYIGVGNAQDYPSDTIQIGSFQIKNYNLGYKFAFCSATNTSSGCEDVGIYTDSDGNNRLALNGAEFAVKFKNADKDLVAYE